MSFIIIEYTKSSQEESLLLSVAKPLVLTLPNPSEERSDTETFTTKYTLRQITRGKPYHHGLAGQAGELVGRKLARAYLAEREREREREREKACKFEYKDDIQKREMLTYALEH